MDKQSVKRRHSEAGREREKETRPDGSEGLFFSGKLSECVTPVYKSPPLNLTRGGERGVGGRGEVITEGRGERRTEEQKDTTEYSGTQLYQHIHHIYSGVVQQLQECGRIPKQR